MTERERLIELLNVDMSGCDGDYAEEMADYLIANGVIVQPCKVGETVYSFCDVFWCNASLCYSRF